MQRVYLQEDDLSCLRTLAKKELKVVEERQTWYGRGNAMADARGPANERRITQLKRILKKFDEAERT